MNLENLYSRRGPAFVVRALVLSVWGLTALTGAVMMAWIAGYLKLSIGQALLGYALMAPTIGLGAFVGAYTYRDTLRTLMRWQRLRGNPDSARGAWDAAVRGVPRGITRAYIGGLVGCVPAAAAMVAIWHEPAYVGPPLWAALATGGAAALVICVFGAELLIRPMVQEIASELPVEHVPGRSALRLRTKALAPLPVVALYSALTVGAFVNGQTSGSLRLVLAISIALTTIFVATGVFLVVTRSALAPLDELLAATERVRDGDLSTAVPILTADDFGRLSASFNRMLQGLREREQFREELRASRARIVAAADAERRRVEREIHDGAQQHLVLMNVKLGVLERALLSDPAKAPSLVTGIRTDLEAGLEELRDLARGIFPPLLESDGLRSAVAEVAKRGAAAAEVDCDGIGRYPAELEAAVYFCCTEALQNTARHAGDGARATVRLTERSRMLQFEISDDGGGFDPTAVPSNGGLQNMTDRIGALGGEVQIRSTLGEGTRIAGTVPLASHG